MPSITINGVVIDGVSEDFVRSVVEKQLASAAASKPTQTELVLPSLEPIPSELRICGPHKQSRTKCAVVLDIIFSAADPISIHDIIDAAKRYEEYFDLSNQFAYDYTRFLFDAGLIEHAGRRNKGSLWKVDPNAGIHSRRDIVAAVQLIPDSEFVKRHR